MLEEGLLTFSSKTYHVQYSNELTGTLGIRFNSVNSTRLLFKQIFRK
jgi:hypothetical protein